MKKVILSFLAASSLFVFLAQPAFAGPLTDAIKRLDNSVGTEKTGLQGGSEQSLSDVISMVITAILSLVGTIFFVFTIYAGVLWMTAQGDEEKVTRAKGIITAAVIGMVITLSAYAITYFVGSKLNKAAAPGAAASSVPSFTARV